MAYCRLPCTKLTAKGCKTSKWSLHFYQNLSCFHFLAPATVFIPAILFIPSCHSYFLPITHSKLIIPVAPCAHVQLRGTFLRAQTMPLRAYTLLCKNTHWPARRQACGCRPPGLTFAFGAHVFVSLHIQGSEWMQPCPGAFKRISILYHRYHRWHSRYLELL